LNGFFERTIGPYRPQFLSILRIVTALLFLQHGTMKIFGFPAGGMPTPEMFTGFWWIGLLEVVGGVLLIIGLLTRPVAFILSGQMAVAYWIAHAPQSFYPVLNGGEAAILFCFVFLYIAAAGPGAWAVDSRTRS
jgi:putative oxidoreductase